MSRGNNIDRSLRFARPSSASSWCWPSKRKVVPLPQEISRSATSSSQKQPGDEDMLGRSLVRVYLKEREPVRGNSILVIPLDQSVAVNFRNHADLGISHRDNSLCELLK